MNCQREGGGRTKRSWPTPPYASNRTRSGMYLIRRCGSATTMAAKSVTTPLSTSQPRSDNRPSSESASVFCDGLTECIPAAQNPEEHSPPNAAQVVLASTKNSTARKQSAIPKATTRVFRATSAAISRMYHLFLETVSTPDVQGRIRTWKRTGGEELYPPAWKIRDPLSNPQTEGWSGFGARIQRG